MRCSQKPVLFIRSDNISSKLEIEEAQTTPKNRHKTETNSEEEQFEQLATDRHAPTIVQRPSTIAGNMYHIDQPHKQHLQFLVEYEALG
jgi:hypothetical protein